MININTLENLINSKSDTAKYYNSISYLYGVLDKDSKVILFSFLSANDLYLTAKCLMSCANDFSKESELAKLATRSLDAKCNDVSSIAMKALIELGKSDIILNKLLVKQSEYKKNNYINSLTIALNNATAEVLLNTMLTCLDYLNSSLNVNSIQTILYKNKNYKMMDKKALNKIIKSNKKLINKLISEVIIKVKHLYKCNSQIKNYKVISNILLKVRSTTLLILLVDAFDIAYCHIPPNCVELMKKHIQSLHENNVVVFNKIGVSEFTKKHLSP